jgi:hypothetical protein
MGSRFLLALQLPPVFGLALSLLVFGQPSVAAAGDTSGAEEASVADEPEATSPAPTLPSLHHDALGRPFPDPKLLRRAEGMMALGITLTASAGVLTIAGLTLGTSIARGQILVGERGRLVPLALMGGGSVLGLVGVPLASSGSQMRGQLLRKTKGVERLPRTVANESRYWNAALRAQYGRSMTISGGASILLGTLAMVAVAGLVGTEQYDPRLWAAPLVSFGLAGAMIPGGLAMRKRALAAMESVRDAVDPLRQPGGTLGSRASPSPQLEPPRPLLSMTRDDAGRTGVVFGLSWSGAL